MTKNEIKTLERVFIRYSKIKKVVHVLEWGSGGSTVYFTRFLDQKGVVYTWRSIEYNQKWYKRVQSYLAGNKAIDLVLFDVGNDLVKQRHTKMEKYISYPAQLKKNYDIIIVDGRKRKRCLEEAVRLIDAGGVVFLHDAQRRYYHDSFSLYRNHTFLCLNLWAGNNEDIGMLKKYINFLRSLFFKSLDRGVVRPHRLLKSKYDFTKSFLSYGKDTKVKIKMLVIISLLGLKKLSLFPWHYTISLSVEKTSPPFLVHIHKYRNFSDFYHEIIPYFKNEGSISF